MTFSHAVVWLDHARAHVLHFDREQHRATEIRNKSPDTHLHHKRGAVGPGRAKGADAFYHAIVEVLRGAGEILVVGPSTGKLELIKHIHRHDHALVDSVVGVESIDHPSEGELLRYARHYFHGKDQLRPGGGISVAPD